MTSIIFLRRRHYRSRRKYRLYVILLLSSFSHALITDGDETHFHRRGEFRRQYTRKRWVSGILYYMVKAIDGGVNNKRTQEWCGLYQIRTSTSQRRITRIPSVGEIHSQADRIDFGPYIDEAFSICARKSSGTYIPSITCTPRDDILRKDWVCAPCGEIDEHGINGSIIPGRASFSLLRQIAAFECAEVYKSCIS